MKLGTKSLLFGVHQFLWHPVTVWVAWRRLYGTFPCWRTTVCIIIHDWGYWGCAEMDGAEGELHPYLGAEIANMLFDGPDEFRWLHFQLGHSRRLSRKLQLPQSQLCQADKLSIAYDPAWFYLFRARLTGELREYRAGAAACGFIPAHAPDRAWHRKLADHERAKAREVRIQAMAIEEP